MVTSRQDTTTLPYRHSFRRRVFEVPEAPDFLTTGDFDNDGRLDVITAAREAARFIFWPETGTAALGRLHEFSWRAE